MAAYKYSITYLDKHGDEQAADVWLASPDASDDVILAKFEDEYGDDYQDINELVLADLA